MDKDVVDRNEEDACKLKRNEKKDLSDEEEKVEKKEKEINTTRYDEFRNSNDDRAIKLNKRPQCTDDEEEEECDSLDGSNSSNDKSDNKMQFYSSKFTMKDNVLVYKSTTSLPPTKPIRKKVIPTENQECFYCKAKSSNTWRKGPDGSKSLCNACGLRYYRLLLKEKNLVPTSTPNPIHSILN